MPEVELEGGLKSWVSIRDRESWGVRWRLCPVLQTVEVTL